MSATASLTIALRNSRARLTSNPDVVQMHSHEYRNPAQLPEGPVLLIGAGNSGAEIAMDLERTHEVHLSGRDVGQLRVPLREDAGDGLDVELDAHGGQVDVPGRYAVIARDDRAAGAVKPRERVRHRVRFMGVDPASPFGEPSRHTNGARSRRPRSRWPDGR